VLLRFEALCYCFFPEACEHEEFCAIYMMRKGHGDARTFDPQKGCDKLIVNMLNSDHGRCDFIVRIA